MGIIGRHKTTCISCDFGAVHVKKNEGRHPYLHCPQCGLMTPAKNGVQAAGLLRGMRPIEIPQPPATDNPIIVRREPAAPPATPIAAPSPAPAAPAKKAGLWDQLMGATKKGGD